MQYYSLKGQAPPASFAEATVQGQAPDGGLYFPAAIPRYTKADLHTYKTLPKEELAYRVMRPYVGDSLTEEALRSILAHTLAFDFPLRQVSDTLFALELFHGPTLAFKDVGARFMSQCLGHFNQKNGPATRPTTVLVATSGDTGGAVANGFLGVDGIEVIILYPSGKVSEVQELQLATCGHNITALEIDGTFDDCQRMVKAAFLDVEVAHRRTLTSANSINIARWLPQQLYYWLAWQQWPAPALPVLAVPSGNFGNIGAGLLAAASGLPVQGFIAACNANATVPTFLETGTYAPQPAIATLSNAMDVADPSNMVRVLALFGQQLPRLRAHLQASSLSDAETVATLKQLHQAYGYLADPHGAVAAAALQQILPKGQRGIFLETAHPIKFAHVLEPILGQNIPVPQSLAKLFSKTKNSIKMPAQADRLRAFLLETA